MRRLICRIKNPAPDTCLVRINLKTVNIDLKRPLQKLEPFLSFLTEPHKVFKMGDSTLPMKSGGKRILFTGGSGKAGRQYVNFSKR
jgi:hypothetical protein